MRLRSVGAAVGVLALTAAVAVWAVVPALADSATATPEATQAATPGGDDGETVRGGEAGQGLAFGFARTVTEFDAAAEALGLTPEELFTQWHDGLSLSEIAEAQGVDADSVEEALRAVRSEAAVESARERLDAAVAAGTMTQEQADWLLLGIEKGYTQGMGALDRPMMGGAQRGTWGGDLSGDGMGRGFPGRDGFLGRGGPGAQPEAQPEATAQAEGSRS